jgi:hypothetical protein
VSAGKTDSLYKEPINNAYQGTGFTITTTGVLEKTDLSASTHAGLTLSDASHKANALFTLDKPAREISLRLSGIDSEQGVKIQLFDVKGNLIEERTIYGDATVFHANAFVYSPADERVDVGSFKILSNEAGLTLDGFTRKDVVHVADNRNPSLISSSTESFYGTDADDIVTLQMSAQTYFSGATAAIHGGNGIDTLKLMGPATTYLPVSSKMTSVEVIEIASSGQHAYLNLSDVLHNGGTDIFYTGDKSRVQMMVKGNVTSSGVVLYEHLVEGINVTGDDTFIGGDRGEWLKKGSVAINGVTYDSYQYSSLAVELLVQQGLAVRTMPRAEFLEAGVKSVGMAAMLDLAGDHQSASMLQDVEPELFASEPSALSDVGPTSAGAGSGTYIPQAFGSDLLDQQHVQHAAY